MINLLVFLGRILNNEILFFPYFEPTESPSTERAAEPKINENINNQFVPERKSVSKIFSAPYLFLISGSSSAVKTAIKINMHPIPALNVIISPKNIMLLNNPNTDSKLIIITALLGLTYF